MVCTALVTLGAAYASYRHGREFALRFGSNPTTATIWPLIVDGLLLIATIELWKTNTRHHTGRWTAWLAFTLGISLSLCANIAAAPSRNPLAITVAACPPLALLLAVALLNRALKHHRTESPTIPTNSSSTEPVDASPLDAASLETTAPTEPPTAEQRMWAFYLTEHAQGRNPTDADLDRIAGTHNYGRRILRKWRDVLA